jgi:hypothetical protein
MIPMSQAAAAFAASGRSFPSKALCSALSVLAALTNGTAAVGQSNEWKGILYEPKSERTVVLYHWEFMQDPNGTWRSRYLTPAGAVAAEDELTWVGGQPAAYRYIRPNRNETAALERAGGKLIFNLSLAGASTRADEPVPALFAVGPSMVLLARQHWAELAAGQRLRVHYGVLDQLRTYAFDVFRAGSSTPHEAGGGVIVRMQLANVILRWFLTPIDLVFTDDGATLLEIRGRALPVLLKDGRPQPVDADLVILNPHSFAR